MDQNPDMDLLKGMQNPEGVICRLQIAGFRLQIAHCKSEFHLLVVGIYCKLSQEIMVVGSYYNIVA